MNLVEYNPNRILQPRRCCENCGKAYKTQTNLQKHLLLCELLKRSKNCSTVQEEDIAIPSPKIMYQLLVELGQKYTRLEKKVDEINKVVIKKKKKIDVIEWLNSNMRPEIAFENLTEKIIINSSHLEFLLHNSFNETLNEIFQDSIYNNDNDDSPVTPIFAFIQNANTLYIWEKNEWTKLSTDKLTRFLQKIQMKISKAFYEWKKMREKDLKENDQLGTLCNNATGKLMAPDLKSESILGKIRNMMYNKMKTDIKAVLEYEFEF
jgi:hypothetical protein